MKIQVLGSGCPTCKTLHKTVRDVIANLGMNTEVEYSTDIAEIVKLGAMSSPVFAIDGKVMTAGKVPSNDEIEKMILSEKKDENLCCSDNDHCDISCKSPEKEKSQGGCSCGGNC